MATAQAQHERADLLQANIRTAAEVPFESVAAGKMLVLRYGKGKPD